MRSLREAFGQYATGVAVVTAALPGGGRAGVTVNSFTSVSLDPPLVLWCLSRRAPSAPAFLAAGRFAVNVLAADQEHLSRRFATPSPDKFAGVETGRGPGGVPLLAGALARFTCRTATTYDGGDHLIFVGEVEHFERSDGEPLVFHSGGYRAFATPERTATWAGV
ncbi:flavin reductase (DIM6/NTAB) family NADH-FMN oxidoreductase RutF [Streptosporangium becharense]|uniref:Flavin reductase (DIM6/NTAB) family NADH-FMN oxidoreductase RutF n=1 Tax=Streptosporangium becharense TaxID=1816182 RepID=A0A7W9MJY9_9ACTN|nr:flavin reductase family protein [Streptosporangium becharense]MBB2910453.1 flavin reductase (DIM6/NTAB) family NADH-FMN oxidoreductase RutF [Streptosporangium becharense]MBB5823196.1 flavin reductase (DIM6/NTAB) family NADH-FMN oxidoreductase RutF [Streptosporangium becharense]